MRCFVVMGVAGCGKTSVGEALAGETGATFLDGDALHPPENIAKMSAGTPLNDADRAPWLQEVGLSLKAQDGLILIGCSALKRSYRNIIRAAAEEPVAFIHLHGSKDVIKGRMSTREGHFMPTSLLDSQFAALEPLGPDETGRRIDIAQPFKAVVTDSVSFMKEAFAWASA